MSGRIILAAGIALALGGPVLAQGAVTSSAVELAQKAAALKPGQWVWAPAVSPDGPVTVFVDLSAQTATVYRNGVRIGVSTVSTGKPGHETPDGVFQILQKDANHHSSKYNSAPMPFQERLTWDGIALHAGGLPGYPESHGCVHLPMAFAKLLFGTTTMGGTVVVAGRASTPSLASNAGVLTPIDTAGASQPRQPLSPDEQYRFQPQLQPTGPVTIIVSRADQRAVVLRNGVEIARSRVAIANGNFETHVLTLASTPAGSRWVLVGVPGHAGEQGQALDAATLAQAQFPAQFLKDMQPLLVQGTTVLVTESPILPGNSGQKLTVMASGQR